MTEEKSFKRRVRERMSKTGESYTAARTKVAHKRDRVKAARSRLAATEDLVSDAALKDATGRKWEQWFSILDRWGARKRKHAEIARFLRQEHGVVSWWSQSITVGYERARGMRVKYQTAEGFSVSASKTVEAPIDALFKAFIDARQRKKWLTDGTMKVRTSQPNHSARFDWEDGSTRVNVGFIDKGPSKSSVAVAHERLADADEAERAKVLWKQRLAELKSFVEG